MYIIPNSLNGFFSCLFQLIRSESVSEYHRNMQPARRFVVHGGGESFAIGNGVEALSLLDMMEALSKL